MWSDDGSKSDMLALRNASLLNQRYVTFDSISLENGSFRLFLGGEVFANRGQQQLDVNSVASRSTPDETTSLEHHASVFITDV